MKKYFLFLLTILLLGVTSFAQVTTRVQTDSLRVFQVAGHTAELILENSTKGNTDAFLQNKGNGRTRFAFALDSAWLISGSLYFRRGATVYSFPIRNGIDSITIRNDSLFEYKDGIGTFKGLTSNSGVVGKLNISDTASMLSPYLRKIDTTNKWVRSVNASISGALGVTGGPITQTGTLAFIWQGSTSQYVRGDGALSTFSTAVTAITNPLYAPITHGHIAADISDFTTATRNLLSGGTGISYNPLTGVIAWDGSGAGITSFNGLTGGTQTLAFDSTYAGASSWSSVGTAHTLRLNRRLFDTTFVHSSAYNDARFVKKSDSSTAGGYYPYSTNPKNYLVAADIAGKLNISDTATMLSTYLRKVDTTAKWMHTLYKRGDSVFFKKGSTEYFSYIDGGAVSASQYITNLPDGDTVLVSVNDSTVALKSFDTADFDATDSTILIDATLKSAWNAKLSPGDTVSLSNRINLKLNISDTSNKWINDIRRRAGTDTVEKFKNGSWQFAYKDSIGVSNYDSAFVKIQTLTDTSYLNLRKNRSIPADTVRISLANGDKGDIDVGSGWSNWVIDTNAVTTIKINNGAVTIAKLSATGTPDSTKFLRGDNVWAAPLSGSGAFGEIKIPSWGVTTNSPATGDSVLTNTHLVGKEVEVYREHEFQNDSSTTYGYEYDSAHGKITFHPMPSQGEVFTIKIYPVGTRTLYSLEAASTTSTYIAFTSAASPNNLTESPTGTWTRAGSGNSYAVATTQSLASSANGYIEAQYISSSNVGAVIGFDAVNSLTDYDQFDYGMYTSAGTWKRIIGGTITDIGTAATTGQYYRIARTGSNTFNFDISSDHVSWTTIYTSTVTTTAQEFPKITVVVASNKASEVKGYGLTP